MKEINMQIRRMRRLLPFGLLPVAALTLAFQENPPTESGQPGKMLNEPINEAQAQRFDRSFESFAPAVKKVAPTVVRIVTALNFNHPADLTSGAQDSLRSHVSGQGPRMRSDLVESGLGSGVIVTEDGL